MTEALDTAVCSVARTQRGRFFWAAWWTGPPARTPFRKPDASNGGAATPEAALAEAEGLSGRALTMTDPIWARAWMRTLRGQAPFTPRDEERLDGIARPERPAADEKRLSAWAILGIEKGATLDEIKRAYRARALATHPDRGGDPAIFRAVQRAYEKALAARPDRGRRARG